MVAALIVRRQLSSTLLPISVISDIGARVHTRFVPGLVLRALRPAVWTQESEGACVRFGGRDIDEEKERRSDGASLQW